MNNKSYSSQLAAEVFHVSRLSGDLFHDSLSDNPDFSKHCANAVLLLSDVWVIRFNMECHCQTENCEFSADEAQNLFSMLDIAKASLERIK